MMLQCWSLGHVSSSSRKQAAVAELCCLKGHRTLYMRNCKYIRKATSDEQGHVKIRGGLIIPRKNCRGKLYPRRTFGTCSDFGYFGSSLMYESGCFYSGDQCSFFNYSSLPPLSRRTTYDLNSKSSQRQESPASDDYVVGLDKAQLPEEGLDGKETDEDYSTRTRDSSNNNGDLHPSDQSLTSTKLWDQSDHTGKARHEKLKSSSLNFSKDSDLELRSSYYDDRPFDGQGGDLAETKGDVDLENRGDSAPVDEASVGMDDYSPEDLPDWDQQIEYVTRINVPRQKYIRISKVELVNELLLIHPRQTDDYKILSICNYLELVLHARHKFMLEELRADYTLTHSSLGTSIQDALKGGSPTGATSLKRTSKPTLHSSSKLSSDSTIREQAQDSVKLPHDAEDTNPSTKTAKAIFNVDTTPGWRSLGLNILNAFKQQRDADVDSVSEAEDETGSNDDEEARSAGAKRFEKNFLKLLKSAQFEGLSAQDLELTAALNSDYLLTLPVVVDWKRASKSNAIIFRRGYAKEKQRGLLLGEKFDYLQSTFLREILKGLTGPLLNSGRWLMQKWKSLRDDPDGRALAETLERWVEEPLQPDIKEPTLEDSDGFAQQEQIETKESDMDMPIWKAAQQAIPRYEAVLSSAGSRGLLIRGILVRMGLLPLESISLPPPNSEDSNGVEPHLRPNFLSRVSMKDIWWPASEAAAGSNIWNKIPAAFRVFFSKVTLEEPAFQELVLLYSDDGHGQSKESGLQLQMYKSIPLPDLKIVFPSKKLSYRLLDLVRLDLTTFVGLFAFTYNYHFDNFFSSPSAFTLDVIAASALLLYITRAALGYKQTWERYQLLVNKTLYEKTLANGFGVVHFLLDSSEEQQFKEAILVFVVLSEQGRIEGLTKKQMANACERILYYRCKEQTKMPVENAINTLLELGLICEMNRSAHSHVHTERRYRALTSDEGVCALKEYWESLPSRSSS